MKLEYTVGCTCNSLTINEQETINLPLEEVKKVCIEAINNVDDLGILQEFLIDFIESYGEYKLLGHCEQCGDYIDNYTLDLPLKINKTN